MRGLPEFNFPAFHAAAAKLRACGFHVFSPAEKDAERHGKDFGKDNPTGSEEQAACQNGFSLRAALEDDLRWICQEAQGIVMLTGWQKSKGALAEKATAEALGLKTFFLEGDYFEGRL
jgi:hypothetical protein